MKVYLVMSNWGQYEPDIVEAVALTEARAEAWIAEKRPNACSFKSYFVEEMDTLDELEGGEK